MKTCKSKIEKAEIADFIRVKIYNMHLYAFAKEEERGKIFPKLREKKKEKTVFLKILYIIMTLKLSICKLSRGIFLKYKNLFYKI